MDEFILAIEKILAGRESTCKKIVMDDARFAELKANVKKHATKLDMTTDKYLDGMNEALPMLDELVDYLVPDRLGLDEEVVRKLAHGLFKRAVRNL